MKNHNKKHEIKKGQTDKPSTGRTIKLPDGRIIIVKPEESIVPPNVKNIKLADSNKTIVVKQSSDSTQQSMSAQKNPESVVELREENVQEILTAVPHWMIRWGNTLFCSLIIMLLLIAWFIQYPEIVSAKMTVHNKFPSQEIFLETEAMVQEVLVSEGDEVSKGTPLLILDNATNYEHILLLQSILDTIQLNSKSFHFPFPDLPVLFLGDLQAVFAEFEDSYLLYKTNEKQIGAIKRIIYEESSAPNKIERLYVNMQFRQLIEHYQKLSAAIKQWNEHYIIKASSSGVIRQLAVAEHQKISANQQLMQIVPEHPPSYVAHLQIPAFNSGKVAVDQKVLLKLDNYSDMEFGLLEGNITSIETYTAEDGMGYIAEVALSDNLLTSYNKELEYSRNLIGTGDIIIKQSRLLEKLLGSMN